MSERDVREDIVRQTLALMGPEFRTKDLSTHALMLEGHPDLRSQSHYHAWVGKFLSQYCDDVRNLNRPTHAKGATWHNLLHAQGQEATPQAPMPAARSAERLDGSSTASVTGIGPQSNSDNAFTARMRLHQSWYRAHVLGVPCGTGPQAQSVNHYGNMLRREDGDRGLNFLDPEIHEVALARLREGNGTVEPFRLLHNMLSSQPMCFNLFGLLVEDRELATRLFRSLPELHVDEVVDVKLEFAPEPAYDYLADRTAFDAFVDYRRKDGARALLGIETKLTEPFSQRQYTSPNYDRWMHGPRSPWIAGASERASDIKHNQLWRDHLLAIAMRDHAGSEYQHATLMLVRHQLDQDCQRTVAGYRTLLARGDQTFVDMPLDRLVDAWQEVIGDDPRKAWLAAFAERYVNLNASKGAR